MSAHDSSQLVQSILRNTGNDVPAPDEILRKADGNPFFLEELTQVFVEQGVTISSVPDTIQAVLAARIDRLAPTEKHLLQTAAVIGRDIPVALLYAIADLPDATLGQGLTNLQTAEFLYGKRGAREPAYTFKHVLMQEVAYESLLASTRRELHQRIAEVLEQGLPETVATQPQLLAHHYTEAGAHEAAVAAWQRAGQQSMERSAYVEAAAQFDNGLKVLKFLPDSQERDQHELQLQMALGFALTPKGYGHPN